MIVKHLRLIYKKTGDASEQQKIRYESTPKLLKLHPSLTLSKAGDGVFVIQPAVLK